MITIETERLGPTTIVRLRGRLDWEAAAELDDRLAPWLARLEGDVVVDVQDVTYLSTHGMAALAELHRQLQRAGRGLRVRGVPRAIARMFRQAGFYFVSGTERLEPPEAPPPQLLEQTRRIEPPEETPTPQVP